MACSASSFWIGAQLRLQRRVAHRVLGARPRAGDRPRDDLAVADPDEQLGRRADQRGIGGASRRSR